MNLNMKTEDRVFGVRFWLLSHCSESTSSTVQGFHLWYPHILHLSNVPTCIALLGLSSHPFTISPWHPPASKFWIDCKAIALQLLIAKALAYSLHHTASHHDDTEKITRYLAAITYPSHSTSESGFKCFSEPNLLSIFLATHIDNVLPNLSYTEFLQVGPTHHEHAFSR